MKRPLMVCGILLTAFVSGMGQRVAFYDAFYLEAITKINAGKFQIKAETRPLLEFYFGKLDDVPLIEAIKANPFLSPYFQGPGIQSIIPGGLPLPGTGKSIGGLNVTNIADGLAKFLAERTKQELSIAFFQDFKETLVKPKYRHLLILFRNTASLLSTIDKDIYQFSNYLQALREAFIKDLNNLFDTAPKVVQDLPDSIFKNIHPSHLKELLLYSLRITKGIKQGIHPGQILEDFTPMKDSLMPRFRDVNAVLQIVQLFSTSVKSLSGEPKRYWIPTDSIRPLLADPDAFKIYLGLVYEKAKAIRFANGDSFQKIMAGVANNIIPYNDFLKNSIEKFNDVQEALDEIKNKKKTEISYNEYYHFFQSVISVLEINEDINRLPGVNIGVPQDFRTFITVADNVNELFLDINMKSYSSGVMRLVAIYDTILKPAYDMIVNTTLAKYAEFRKKLIKYGTFLANVADANSSDEIKKAIETVALPSGSASIKKHSSLNIAISAYVGPFYGMQKLASDNDSKSVAGFFSPVGVSLSTAIGAGSNPGSFSLFISAIDIGALTAFRFSNPDDTLASNVQVKLSQIVAPGIHAVFGFPRLPLSVGIGHHWLPLLSKVEKESVTLHDAKGWRWQVFAAVDIPIFNLYNKSK